MRPASYTAHRDGGETLRCKPHAFEGYHPLKRITEPRFFMLVRVRGLCAWRGGAAVMSHTTQDVKY